MHCNVMYCNVLYCTVLYCTVPSITITLTLYPSALAPALPSAPTPAPALAACPAAARPRERLHIKPEENAVLFTEPTHNTKEAREKTVQMAFEHLRCGWLPSRVMLVAWW
jgi:hypothetical protein